MDVEGGDLIEYGPAKGRIIGVVADRGGAGGWRVVDLTGSRVGQIRLGNDCDNPVMRIPKAKFLETVRVLTGR